MVGFWTCFANAQLVVSEGVGSLLCRRRGQGKQTCSSFSQLNGVFLYRHDDR